jgi:energy-converting hydrogenase Eha subunit B
MTKEPTADGATEQARRLVLARKMPELLYGAVVSASLLAISSLHGATTEHVAIATVAVAVTYWLAHVYVDAVGGRFEDPGHTMHSRLGKALRENTEILVGSLPPVLVFLLGRLLGLPVGGAAWLALWFTVALLTGAGAFAAHLAGVRGKDLVIETVVAGAFGLVVIVLKYVLH